MASAGPPGRGDTGGKEDNKLMHRYILKGVVLCSKHGTATVLLLGVLDASGNSSTSSNVMDSSECRDSTLTLLEANFLYDSSPPGNGR